MVLSTRGRRERDCQTDVTTAQLFAPPKSDIEAVASEPMCGALGRSQDEVKTKSSVLSRLSTLDASDKHCEICRAFVSEASEAKQYSGLFENAMNEVYSLLSKV